MRRILLALLLTLGTAVTSQAQVLLDVPEETQPPFYARVSRDSSLGLSQEIHHDDQWAAIPFYRDPACIPADFNLLQMVDFTPDPVSRAVGGHSRCRGQHEHRLTVRVPRIPVAVRMLAKQQLS